MVSGVVSWSSKVEFEAKRVPRRSAFSFTLWTKMSFPVRNGGSEDWLELSSPKTDDTGRVALKLLADFGDMLKRFSDNLNLIFEAFIFETFTCECFCPNLHDLYDLIDIILYDFSLKNKLHQTRLTP